MFGVHSGILVFCVFVNNISDEFLQAPLFIMLV